MCSVTRFPEAIPMRKITAPAVAKALVKFFSLFGLPKEIQTDQGSNFMSRVFAQVMKQLDITHHYSSAYHPESQGALERFHSTLKSMLRAYCFEVEKDWDEGVHLLLFAAREVAQESLGFSPAELVFAHTVRGPLKLLQEKWLDDNKPQNLCDYVSNFRGKLHRACELAKQNMSITQAKMKRWFDKDAKNRSFSPGDTVLVLLPVPGSALQARYSGPYVVKEKLGDRDYIVATPDRKRRNRVCHVNMLKPYLCRESTHPTPGSEVHNTVLALSSAEAAVSSQVMEELSGAGTPRVLPTVAAADLEDVVGPSLAVVQGRLQNSAMSKLDECFLHLRVPA
ncbi:retrovirus-related Pol polyprotein from transposon 412 isoform X1 [Amphiprion ocellaris]|uniref:retrovirus-related Pol polyprotein from transposon 412 isoform X1 n=1 Tax=Amphiprion ocellaris TaxID=80972 RepID=UPI0024111775|nr:retrovirus-related Pol polyprotein from transposon 412 isoform X1 [Amphiprion ocellaris]XP_054867014.1 retrovirus-related Pol polyprotein from transposon 412 isoform X1 [Amphiprion ocellaris]XP_054867016.1 retrovirus-related Pol polyprotein from transposon 412 isoform X1 [Amphiprion ocellaris]